MHKCSARRHLRGADFAVYDAAMQLTARSRANGEPGICNASIATLVRLTNYCEDTITVSRKRLIVAGWFKPLAGAEWIKDQRRSRAKRGWFQAPQFVLVEHEDWALEHHGECESDGLSTVEEFSVHGGTEDGSDGNGNVRKTVHGSTPETLHGKPRHKALKGKPEGTKPEVVAAKRIEDLPEWVQKEARETGKSECDRKGWTPDNFDAWFRKNWRRFALEAVETQYDEVKNNCLLDIKAGNGVELSVDEQRRYDRLKQRREMLGGLLGKLTAS